VREIESLMTRLGRDVPEFRRQQALAYPLAGMLVLIAMAMFSGVSRGYEDLADYAATLSQAQLRALRFRQDPRTRRVRCPQRTTFERVLKGLDEARLQQVLLLWQEQVLGPVEDRLVIIDGKTLRHAGVTTVSAVNGTGRNPRRPPAIGPVGLGGQDRGGRRCPHPGGPCQADPLPTGGRVSADR
jgi:hypothetical protein